MGLEKVLKVLEKSLKVLEFFLPKSGHPAINVSHSHILQQTRDVNAL